MGSLKTLFCLAFAMGFWDINVSIVAANTTTVVSPAGPTGQSKLDVLAAQTANLAAKLNEEIAKREALEKEVQSKNDLTEFLRQDIQTLNKTLELETNKRLNIETTLSQVQVVINNVRSTLGEDRENVLKVSRDLRALESRLTSETSSFNKSLHHLQVQIDSNHDGVQNISSTVSEIELKLENQTLNIDLMYQLNKQENKTIQQKLEEISSRFETTEKEVESQEKALNSTISAVDNVKVELINHNRDLNALATDLSVLNKSTEVFTEHSTTRDAAFNVSLEAIRRSVESFKRSTRTDVQDIKMNVTDLVRKINQYALLTRDYNKTLGVLTAHIAQASQTESSEVYFFASKPRNMLRSNHPPVFTSFKFTDNSFDPQTSLFTSPIGGIYMFTVTIQKDVTETNQGVQCWLKKNGSLQLLIDAHSAFIGSAPSATNTIITELTKGDQIQLTQCSGPVFISAEGSSFSGVLLHAH